MNVHIRRLPESLDIQNSEVQSWPRGLTLHHACGLSCAARQAGKGIIDEGGLLLTLFRVHHSPRPT